MRGYRVTWRTLEQAHQKTQAKPPYGYDFSASGFTLTVNGQEADVVRMLFESRAHHATLADIALALNEKGVPPPKGKEWRQSAVRRIIENGTHLYRGETVAFPAKDTEELLSLPEDTVPRIREDDLAARALSVEEADQQENP
jgi:hypothetical protein